MYTIHVFSQLAKKHNMVIISPILERDELHGDILANTAGMYVKYSSASLVWIIHLSGQMFGNQLLLGNINLT